MPYASAQDIVDRYGEDRLLVLADRDGDGQADQDALDRALADAVAEVDGYVAARHALPLPGVPLVLTRLAVDIAVYRLAGSADVLTDEIRTRYEDAVGVLRRISSGDVSLGLAPAPTVSGGTVEMLSQPARFGRGRFRP